MKPLLLDQKWKAKGDDERVRLACSFLDLENVRHGVVFGVTKDCHHFENAWMLFLQQSET